MTVHCRWAALVFYDSDKTALTKALSMYRIESRTREFLNRIRKFMDSWLLFEQKSGPTGAFFPHELDSDQFLSLQERSCITVTSITCLWPPESRKQTCCRYRAMRHILSLLRIQVPYNSFHFERTYVRGSISETSYSKGLVSSTSPATKALSYHEYQRFTFFDE